MTSLTTAAVTRLVRRGLGYVPTVARRFRGSGLELDELIAAGNLGLVEAALRFDASRNLKFVTYADWWIRKAIREAIATLTGPVRLPRSRAEKLRWLKQTRARWVALHGAEPTLEELSVASSVPLAQVRRALATEPRGIPLDRPSHPAHDRPVLDSLPDRKATSPQQNLIRSDLAHHLQRELASLAPREREVIRLRFGLDGEPPRTLRRAGVLLGLSRERVRRIELEVLLKIRREL